MKTEEGRTGGGRREQAEQDGDRGMGGAQWEGYHLDMYGKDGGATETDTAR